MSNIYTGHHAGQTLITTNEPIDVRRFFGHGAGSTVLLVNINAQTTVPGYIEDVMLTGADVGAETSAQGLGIHAGDAHDLLIVRRIHTTSFAGGPRDGGWNGEHIDLHGASRVLVEWWDGAGGYRGIKLGGGGSWGNRLRHARVEDLTSIAGGGDVRAVEVEDYTWIRTGGFELRPGITLINCRGLQSLPGVPDLLVTGERRCFVIGGHYERVAIDPGTTLVADSTARFDNIEFRGTGATAGRLERI